MKFVSLLLFVSLLCEAPEYKVFYMEVVTPIKPYEKIWKAICQVESKQNPLAFNPQEHAYGVAQIRPIRLQDYNQRTGKTYKMEDMFDSTKSREVFIYYAVRIGHDNTDQIIRSWNGRGKKTYEYLKKVKRLLQCQ